VDPSRAIMIGDRSHDIVGARNNGMSAIGVLYGYGSREELTQPARSMSAPGRTGCSSIWGKSGPGLTGPAAFRKVRQRQKRVNLS